VLCTDTGKCGNGCRASSMFIFLERNRGTDLAGDMVERDARGFILTGPLT